MAEKWRRCDKCRKVKAVDDFEADAVTCQACNMPVVKRTLKSGGEVTTTRAPRVSRPTSAAAAGSAAMVRTTAMSDLRGKGDPEVRSRRARARALDRLAEQYSDDFESLLADERRAEGL